jgi:S1-C subfamily serine protease
MDGTPVDSRETLSRLVGDKKWGDSAILVLRRGGETINRTVYFRREPADGEPVPAKQ